VDSAEPFPVDDWDGLESRRRIKAQAGRPDVETEREHFLDRRDSDFYNGRCFHVSKFSF
jgi:hypothetical protein